MENLNNYYQNVTATITDCLVTNNSATNGGGVYQSGIPLLVSACTFSLNTASGSGGGIYDASNTVTLNDDILFNGRGGEATDGPSSGASVTVNYCDVNGGFAGTGNFDKNPLFVNPAAGDFHLNTGSPCIGKGTPITGSHHRPGRQDTRQPAQYGCL